MSAIERPIDANRTSEVAALPPSGGVRRMPAREVERWIGSLERAHDDKIAAIEDLRSAFDKVPAGAKGTAGA